MVPCIFCQIISGEREGSVVGSNEHAIAFLDRCPVNTGHTLIVPRRHVSSFIQLTDPENTAMHQLVRQIGRAFLASFPGCGISLSAADGEPAGQEVPHAHFHLIPRSTGDGFGWRRFGTPADRASLEATASIIRGFAGDG